MLHQLLPLVQRQALQLHEGQDVGVQPVFQVRHHVLQQLVRGGVVVADSYRLLYGTELVEQRLLLVRFVEVAGRPGCDGGFTSSSISVQAGASSSAYTQLAAVTPVSRNSAAEIIAVLFALTTLSLLCRLVETAPG